MTATTRPTSTRPTSPTLGAVSVLAPLTRHLARWVWDTLCEAWWVARCLPRLVLVLLVATGLAIWAGHLLAGSGTGLGLAGLLAWPSWGPTSWLRVSDRAAARSHRRTWDFVAVAVGLSTTRTTTDGSVQVVPRLLRRGTTTREGVATLRLRYAPGQTLADVERSAPAIAAMLAGHSVRVAPDGPTRAIVTLALRDQLHTTTYTPRPVAKGGHPLASVEVGRTMSGQPWTVNARVHSLVAGATGSGKGSVMWSLLLALGPAVTAGTVRLVGIDLKAGMELIHGRGMFSAVATTPEEAVAVLEREADLMAHRAHGMAGHARSHAPSEQAPHVLVVIDELAALTSYITDRDLMRRADAALRLLLTQGRAPGWTVWAWVQDPRKDTVPMRNLFPQMIGLRLKDTLETDMVLGEGRSRTAPCHHIADTQPGTGYAITEDGHATKLRAHYATDEQIHATALAFPTAHPLGIPDLEPSPDPLTPWTRSARTPTSDPAQLHDTDTTERTEQKQRKPRSPRAPRAPRDSTATAPRGEVA